jgi:hypothetical protein
MCKNVILGELAGLIFWVGWCGELAGVPFWESIGAGWRPAFILWRIFILSFAVTEGTLPCGALVGQETTEKWLYAVEWTVVAGGGRSNGNLNGLKKCETRGRRRITSRQDAAAGRLKPAPTESRRASCGNLRGANGLRVGDGERVSCVKTQRWAGQARPLQSRWWRRG